jgi:hypothetical protein
MPFALAALFYSGSVAGGDGAAEPGAGDGDAGIVFKVLERKKVEGGGLGVTSVEYGTFEVEANLYNAKTVSVYYAVPFGADGKPVPTASDVVFLCPFLHKKRFFMKCQWFPEVAGMTWFSMRLDAEQKDLADRNKCYYYPEYGAHDLTFRVKGIIERRFGLKSRNLLLYGASGGAVMAKYFVERYYYKVDAASFVGGYNDIFIDSPPAPWDAKTACLIMFVTGADYDDDPDDSLCFIQLLRLLGEPKWSGKGGRCFHHSPGYNCQTYTHLFLKGVADLRRAHGGKLPEYKKWPWKLERGKGLKPLYFPSKDFMEEWIKLPHEELKRMMSAYHEEKILEKPVFLVPGGGVKPKSVVVYIHDPSLNFAEDDVLLVDCLYYIMLSGSVACSVQLKDTGREAYKKVADLIEEVKKKKEWKGLPIYVAGVGKAGNLAAAAAFRHGDDIHVRKIKTVNGGVTVVRKKTERERRVKRVVTINSPLTEKDIAAFEKKARAGSRIPWLMVYGEDKSSQTPKNAPPLRSVEIVKASGLTLDKQWFPVLDRVLDLNAKLYERTWKRKDDKTKKKPPKKKKPKKKKKKR